MNNSENTELFERMPIPKAIRIMAIPTVISQLIVLIYNIADTFFIGRTGNPYMVAGASLILPVFNLTLVISSLAGSGGGSLMARLLGQERISEARKVFSFSVYLALFISAFFSIFSFIFATPLLGLLGADEKTFSFAYTYVLMVVILGGVPTVISNTLAVLIRSVGESKKAGFGITMGGIINIFLDPLFMFVLFPKGMEILGAGSATCLSNIIACSYFLIVLYRKRSDPVLKMTSPRNLPDKESIKSVFVVGLPTGIATLLFDIDYMVIDKLIAGYDAIALAAIGIVLKVERLPLNIGIGICQGMLPIVAYNYASKNYKRMNGAKNYSLLLGWATSIISVILYEIFARELITLFISDSQTVALGTYFLRARVLATPFMFMSFFYVYLFNAYGNGKNALILGVMRWLGFNIPMLFLLDHLIGLNGIVWAQLIADVINVIFSVIIYSHFQKREFGSHIFKHET